MKADQTKTEMKSNSIAWGLLGLTAVGLVASFWPRRTSERFADADRRLKELIEEEKHQTRPFPKDVDLEPAYE